MTSIEEVMVHLKDLRPEQIDEVATIVRRLAKANLSAATRSPAIPADVVAEASQHGWPIMLFTELIGSLPDFERPAQPPLESRPIGEKLSS